MDALERLDKWQADQRGRSVELFKPSGYYGPHDWELRLINVNIKPEENWIETAINNNHVATVFAIDSTCSNSQYMKADNFIQGIEEGDLETLIHLAIDKANNLGL